MSVSWSSSSYSVKSTAEDIPEVGRCKRLAEDKRKVKAEDIRGVPLQPPHNLSPTKHTTTTQPCEQHAKREGKHRRVVGRRIRYVCIYFVSFVFNATVANINPPFEIYRKQHNNNDTTTGVLHAHSHHIHLQHDWHDRPSTVLVLCHCQK